MQNRSIRSGLIAFGVAAAAAMTMGSLQAKPINYKLPPEAAKLKPGLNLDVAAANCSGCHSADYMQTQPQGPKFKKDFWTAEVNKMIKVYGAPIDEADIGKIVDYLTAAY